MVFLGGDSLHWQALLESFMIKHFSAVRIGIRESEAKNHFLCGLIWLGKMYFYLDCPLIAAMKLKDAYSLEGKL